MRAILLTEELMGVALKFNKKSSTMGSLWVSWEPAINPLSSDSSSLKNSSSIASTTGCSNRKVFRRRMQTSISLCAATLFFTILVFCFVCSLDSSTNRTLNPPSSSSSSSLTQSFSESPPALQGLGMIFRQGSKSMSELIIAHVAEDLTKEELRLFLRSLHRSGLGSRADLVLLFPGDPRQSELASVVDEESHNFNKLLSESGCTMSRASSPSPSSGSNESIMNLGPQCMNSNAEVLLASNSSLSRLNLEASGEAALNRLLKNNSNKEDIARASAAVNRSPVSLGTIMGFDIVELDPLDTLSGFIDRPPIQLRRWLCYQMLLGMAKQQHHRYRQVLISQIRGVFIFGDSLLAMARRHKDNRALILVTENKTWLEDASEAAASKKMIVALAAGREILSDQADDFAEESEENAAAAPKKIIRKRSRRRSRKLGLIEEVYGRQVWGSIEREDKAGWAVVSSAVVAGGTRAVRALADAVATEVARASMIRKNHRAFSDQAALNYVVRRNVNVLGRKVVERIAFVDGGRGEAGVLTWAGGELDGTARYDVVVDEDFRGEIAKRVVRDLCSSPRERDVYRDCQQEQHQQESQN